MKWSTRQLKEVAPARPSPIRFSPDDVVWHLTLDQIESNTGYIIEKKIAPASEAGTSTFIFDYSNVLYSKLRPYLNKVVCPSEAGIGTTELVPLRPCPGVLDRHFLTYYLRSKYFLAFATIAVAGVKMPRIIMAKFWKHQIPLPPISEQRRIVDILDQADALRKKRAEADAKAARILPALFYKMFGDPLTNSKGWPVKCLGDLGDLDRGRSKHRPRNDPILLGGPYPFIQTGDVSNAKGYIRAYSSTYSKIGLTQSKMWPAGTLCITIAANIAASAILGFDSCFPDSVVGFTPGPHTNSGYIRVLLSFLRPILERSAPQVAQKNINLKILRELPVPVPPKKLQDDFLIHYDRFFSLNESQLEVRRNLDKTWGSLLHLAFTGDLTTQWREAHMKELMVEIEQQTKMLGASVHTARPKSVVEEAIK